MTNDPTQKVQLEDFTKEQLIQWLEDAAKLWLAHDGLWFQAIEKKHGMDEAMEADTEAWRHFSPIEAKKIMKRLGLSGSGGLPDLALALRARLYTILNEDEVELSDDRLIYTMKKCRVQTARNRKGLDDFPCKSVGIVEYTTFAQSIDPRIKTRCLTCPPDPHGDEFYCRWEFTLE